MKFSPTIACLIVVGIASSRAHLVAQTIQVSKENRTIAVTATDKVTAPADTATVHIGFIVYASDSDVAYASASRLSNTIMEALHKAGVPADAIESENQAIALVQEYQVQRLTPEERAQHKFQLTQSWTVRTNAADSAKVLDLAVKAGANQSGQIDWSLKDENAPQAEAATKALAHARTVAQQMAAQLNAKLGVLVYASNETQMSPVRPLMRSMAGMVIGGIGPAPEPLAINPRQIEKIATVYAVFAIE